MSIERYRPKCFGCYGNFLCCNEECVLLNKCKEKSGEMEILSSTIVKESFCSLNDIKREIQDKLMSMVQNEGFPITRSEIMRFEREKDMIVKKLNEINLNIKIDYKKQTNNRGTKCK